MSDLIWFIIVCAGVILLAANGYGLSVENKRLNGVIDVLAESNQGLEAERDRFRDGVLDAENRVDKLKSEVRGLSTNLDTLKKQHERLSKESLTAEFMRLVNEYPGVWFAPSAIYVNKASSHLGLVATGERDFRTLGSDLEVAINRDAYQSLPFMRLSARYGIRHEDLLRPAVAKQAIRHGLEQMFADQAKQIYESLNPPEKA
jgi:hypothetical protein